MPIQLKTKGETVMKRKVVVTVFISALVLSLSGCNSNTDSETKVQESNTTDSAEPNEEEIDSQEEILSEENEVPSTGFSTEYTVENAKDGYFIVSKLDGELYGLLDSYGNEVLPLEYDSIEFPESKEAEAVIVEAEGNKGIVDYEGTTMLPLEYEAISNYGSNSDFYLVQKAGTQSLVRLDGTVEQSLKGTYDAILNNSFLVSGLDNYLTEYSAHTVYNLNEELLYECKYEKSQRSEYDYILSMDYVDGLIKLFKKSPEIYSSLMDTSGQIIFTTTDNNPTDWDISSLQNNNLFRISGDNQSLYNLSTGEVSEAKYKNIVYADEDTILASTEDGGNVDVYNMKGEIENTLNLSAESISLQENSALIVAKYGETYRIYDKDGVELSDERYLDVEPIESYWMIQDLDGNYGLMGNSGDIVIEFGSMGEESYNGLGWKDVYSFDDTFCIVTESSSESNVWLFSK